MTQAAQADISISSTHHAAWRPYVAVAIEGTWVLLCGALAATGQVGHTQVLARLALAWGALPLTLGFVLFAWLQHRRGHWASAHAVPAMLAAAAIGLVAAANAGLWPLAVWFIGLVAAGLLALAAGTDTLAMERWFYGLYLALAWMGGTLAVAFEPGLSLALAPLYGLSAYGTAYRLQRGGSGVTWLLRAVWVALCVLPLLMERALPVGLVAAAAFSQQSWDRRAMAWLRGDTPPHLPGLIGRLGWMAAAAVIAATLAAEYAR